MDEEDWSNFRWFINDLIRFCSKPHKINFTHNNIPLIERRLSEREKQSHFKQIIDQIRYSCPGIEGIKEWYHILKVLQAVLTAIDDNIIPNELNID